MGLFNKQTKKEIIVVEGMKCVHCVAKVTDALKKVHVKAEVNLESKTVTVSYNDKKITLEDYANALKFSPYEILTNFRRCRMNEVIKK